MTVLKHLNDGVDYDGEGTRHLVRVRAEDGWEGEIWDYELEPATDRAEGAPPDGADLDQVPRLAG